MTASELGWPVIDNFRILLSLSLAEIGILVTIFIVITALLSEGPESQFLVRFTIIKGISLQLELSKVVKYCLALLGGAILLWSLAFSPFLKGWFCHFSRICFYLATILLILVLLGVKRDLQAFTIRIQEQRKLKLTKFSSPSKL